MNAGLRKQTQERVRNLEAKGAVYFLEAIKIEYKTPNSSSAHPAQASACSSRSRNSTLIGRPASKSRGAVSEISGMVNSCTIIRKHFQLTQSIPQPWRSCAAAGLAARTLPRSISTISNAVAQVEKTETPSFSDGLAMSFMSSI